MPLIPGQPPRPVSVGRASVSDLAQYMIQFHRTHGRPVIPLPSAGYGTHLALKSMSFGRASVSDLAQFAVNFGPPNDRLLIPIPSEGHQKFINASKGMGEKRHGLSKPVILFVLLVAQKKLGICPSLDLCKLTSMRLRKILKTHLDKILTKPFLVAE